MQRNRGKQQNGKDQRSLQDNQRYPGNISCKDEHNKGQKWYGPNRSRNIKKRQQEYTEELYIKDLHDPDNQDGVITDPEPNILECKVNAKWALENITTSKEQLPSTAQLYSSHNKQNDAQNSSSQASTVRDK